MYSNGASEEIMGAVLREFKIPRRKVVIMTKVYRVMPDIELPQDHADAKKNVAYFEKEADSSKDHVNQWGEPETRSLPVFLDHTLILPMLQASHAQPSLIPLRIHSNGWAQPTLTYSKSTVLTRLCHPRKQCAHCTIWYRAERSAT